MTDRTLTVTLFTNVAGQSIRHESMPWQALVALLSAPPVKADKRHLPMFVPTRYGDVWSTTKAPSLKHGANVLGPVSAVVGDVDGSDVPPAEAASRLQAVGVEALVVTTTSHAPTEGRHSYRIVAPLREDAPLDDLPKWVSFLNGTLDGLLAAESWDRRRAWFYGRKLGAPFEHHRSHGQCLDALADRIEPRGHHRVPVSAHAGLDPDALEFIAWCRSEDRKLTGEVAEVVALFNETVGGIEHIRSLLDAHGYEQIGDQWRRPGSTGAPGVQVTRCGQRIIIRVTKQRDGADDLKFGFTLEPTFLRYDEDDITEIVVPVAMAAPVDAVKRGRRPGRPSAWGPAVQQALDGLDGPAPEAQVIAAAKAAYSAAGGAAGKNSAASIRRELQRLADEGLLELASGVVSVTEVDPLS